MQRTATGLVALGVLFSGLMGEARAGALPVTEMHFSGSVDPTVDAGSDYYFAYAAQLPGGGIFSLVEDLGQISANQSTNFSFDANVPLFFQSQTFTFIAAAGSNDPGGLIMGFTPTVAQNAVTAQTPFGNEFPGLNESSLSQSLENNNQSSVNGALQDFYTNFQDANGSDSANVDYQSQLLNYSFPSDAGSADAREDPPPTPEPATIMLLASGCLTLSGFGLVRRRRAKMGSNPAG